MKFEQKPEAQLQAQAEHYADNEVEKFSDEQKILLKYSQAVSEISDLNNLPEDLPEELKRAIEENKENYVHLLRSIKKEDLIFKKENAELYKLKFKSVIDDLKEKINKSENPKEFPEYLGSGMNGSAYVVEIDGEKYAAKFLNSIAQANFEIKPLIKAKGIENVAQLASYSFEDGVVITELLPGTDVTNFKPEEDPNYPDEHIVELIKKVIELDSKGIVIDPKPSNFLYDNKKGFSILDFHLSNGEVPIGPLVINLRAALTARKWPDLDYGADDWEEQSEKQKFEIDKIELPMMLRFLTILQNQFPEILDSWRKDFKKNEDDPRVSQTPLINRKYIQTENPKLKPYLTKLKELGF